MWVRRASLAVLVVVAGLALAAGAGADSPPVQYTLTISSVGFQSAPTFIWVGAVTPPPQGCLYPCTFTYAAGTTVHLETAPTTVSHFAGWGGDCSGDSVDVNGDSLCDVVMTANRSVTVDFEQGQFVPPPIPPPSPPPAPAPYVPPLDLVVSLSSTIPTATRSGEKLALDVSVTQWSSGYAPAVHVEVTLPAGFTVLSASDDEGHGCTQALPTLSCDVGAVVQGEPPTPNRTVTLTIWGLAGRTGEEQFTATAADTTRQEPADMLANNSATLQVFIPKPSGATIAGPDLGRTVLLSPRTRTGSCTVAANPDRRCSPGAYYSKLTKAVICSAGFRTSTIRNVPESENTGSNSSTASPPRATAPASRSTTSSASNSAAPTTSPTSTPNKPHPPTEHPATTSRTNSKTASTTSSATERSPCATPNNKSP